MDTVERQQQTGIRFRKEHLALLRQIWEHRIWDDPELVTELEHVSEPHGQAASPPPHDAISQTWEDGAWTSDEEDEDETMRLEEGGGGETDILSRACSDSEDDWEAEVGMYCPLAPQGMHHGHLRSSAISVSPAVPDLLELCFRLNITPITDRFSSRMAFFLYFIVNQIRP